MPSSCAGGLPIELSPLSDHVLANLDARAQFGVLEQRLELCLPLLEHYAGEIEVVEIDQVERVVQ